MIIICGVRFRTDELGVYLLFLYLFFLQKMLNEKYYTCSVILKKISNYQLFDNFGNLE